MDNKIKEIRFDCARAKEFFEECLAYTIGPIDVKNLMEEGDITLLDVRREADYEISHIPSAISIPKDSLADNLDKLDKNIPTVVYSYNQQCHLSYKAALIVPPVCVIGATPHRWRVLFRYCASCASREAREERRAASPPSRAAAWAVSCSFCSPSHFTFLLSAPRESSWG